jgi:hypothetical protein
MKNLLTRGFGVIPAEAIFKHPYPVIPAKAGHRSRFIGESSGFKNFLYAPALVIPGQAYRFSLLRSKITLDCAGNEGKEDFVKVSLPVASYIYHLFSEKYWK